MYTGPFQPFIGQQTNQLFRSLTTPVSRSFSLTTSTTTSTSGFTATTQLKTALWMTAELESFRQCSSIFNRHTVCRNMPFQLQVQWQAPGPLSLNEGFIFIIYCKRLRDKKIFVRTPGRIRDDLKDFGFISGNRANGIREVLDVI